MFSERLTFNSPLTNALFEMMPTQCSREEVDRKNKKKKTCKLCWMRTGRGGATCEDIFFRLFPASEEMRTCCE